MTHGSLFSGIGGFDLGFERAGIETVWQVENDEYCRRVLARHFPNAKRYDDVRKVGAHNLSAVDILSGGFPCQDISSAGKRAGIDGERSVLWSEYARIIRELRPRFVVVENVAALLGRGMERVLGDLAAIGYDAEWQSIRASDVGAPHRRERIWIVADSERNGRQQSPQVFCRRESLATTRREDLGNTDSQRLADPQGCDAGTERNRGRAFGYSSWWNVEPNVGRVAHGIPARVDRLKGLGNAVVPQITEWIGRRIVFTDQPQPTQ
jgi:DNA (cytosine-5)-methyltransferase 1